ncbi:hypothetical protein LOTGIDRAFT_153535 [Lottia gigantea]|uniref:Uncharacterized protein n=1 Tax=Lottia gigantea TaxID=225164 RepID=V4AB76_LOTGI|nr:hypothetical protein LOTGIDRAFT_153535 [Lottia gigantea]ESO94052.1 hypothetical protein LOTGIDRAFT_153535 [Lottia gigantea]
MAVNSLHYGFQSTGAHFIDFNDIHLESDEKAEDLYQRLSAFVEDNLLRQGGNITHHGVDVTEDEEASPTLENLVVLSWLRLIHHDLPKLVKQRYGTELRTRTLASIKPEISQALESLLLEIHTRTMRTSTGDQFLFSRGNPKASNGRTTTKPNRATKVCPKCQQAKRPYFNHFLSECRFLPDQDRKFLAKARQITKVVDDTSEFPQEENTGPSHSEPATTLRVQVRQSPYLNAFYAHHVAHITIDSGATGNLISHSTVKKFGIVMSKSSQSARQADGQSPLKVIGEVILYSLEMIDLLHLKEWLYSHLTLKY